MKGVLEFNLPEEQDEFDTACKAGAMSAAISEIANEVFRPARKHGYSDEKIRNLIEKYEGSEELVGALEEKFYEILNSHRIET